MVRRYAEPVHVRPDRAGNLAGEGPPSSFLWRGRLYVVRTVLGHWRERRAWWAEGAARAVHGDDAGPLRTAAPAPAATRQETAAGRLAALAGEREVWRVEAGCGRAAGLGVYDLCRGPDRTWSLLRVSD